MDFVVSTSNVNSYGFRVLTEGIDTSAFLKNPIMLYDHNRWMMPIGKWTNLRQEGDKLIATAQFDEGDEIGKEVKRKCEEGYLNACSVGLDVLSYSEEPALLMPGQTRPTVTKAVLYEISIVDIPGNPDALKLRWAEKGITLSGKLDQTLLNDQLPPVLQMKNIAIKLGLAETATEQELLDKIAALQADAANTVPALLAFGRAQGVITDTNEPLYKSLAEKDFTATLGLIKAAQPAKTDTTEEKVSDLIKEVRNLAKGKEDTDPRAKWTHRDYEKNDPQALLRMETEEPERYKKLYDAEYKQA